MFPLFESVHADCPEVESKEDGLLGLVARWHLTRCFAIPMYMYLVAKDFKKGSVCLLRSHRSNETKVRRILAAQIRVVG